MIDSVDTPVTSPCTVLHLAHNHPEFHAGGTEIFARTLAAEQRRAGLARSQFLGAALPQHRRPHPGTAIAADPSESGDFVLVGGRFEARSLSQADFGYLQDLGRVLEAVRPDVVHFHHVLLLGLESILLARRLLPSARLVMTLHDYYTICSNDGLMVRTDGELCQQASPGRCAHCLPDSGLINQRLRWLAVRTAFEQIDQFVAPSHFLANRFIQWGLNAERLAIIPNGHPDAEHAHRPRPRHRAASAPLVIGFFGHLNTAKGLTVLLRALQRLRDRSADPHGLPVRVVVHGSDRFAPDALKDELAALRSDLGALVRVHGAYSQPDVHRLMQAVDWVAVPSIWWENDPLVIQEAFLNRRPVLCSNIGGMAERVEHERTGLHVPVGDIDAWADALERIAQDAELTSRLAAELPMPPSMAHCARAYHALYNNATV
ncbi:Glycosyltransferase involved in cell wall bisynthesis [Allochromatium warmingii]|uniref:Glycosyltransferase involved in cell wall bisynthesis n=1 Tax=Allochromatium warmingii TaxID=61595 RepID=A0A1H3E7A7_ALLWA|nr:glycosyltransferase family 4 protein [Allochromatium warmingii]SDX73779.1 Glycosyltransferase involved in cell wall bisynthesis [Allochromatium warmingii]